jgi:hypothetical protein
MKAFFVSLFTLAALVSAQAQFQFSANLTPAGDGGGARTGTGTFLLTLTGTTMTINGNFSGLSANSTAAHIHGPSGPLPGTASVLYDFTASGLGLATLGSTAGTINGTFGLVAKGTYTVAQQVTDLQAGLWYLNVHSTAFPGGEIRGQVLPVPEPSSLALAGLGLIGLAAWRVRRRVR